MSGLNGTKRTSTGQVNEQPEIKKPAMEADSWCYTQTKEVINHSFAWTIEGFSAKMEIYKKGESIISDRIKVEVDCEELHFNLRVFPNGKIDSIDTTGAVSVMMYPANRQTLGVPFSFAIGLVSADNNRTMKGRGQHSFKDMENTWGWPRLVTHESVRCPQEKLLTDDKLNIFCVFKFGVKDETYSGMHRPSGSNHYNADNMTEKDSSNFLMMLNTGDLSDFTIVCEGEQFRVHSFILGARSPVFLAALVHNMQEKATGYMDIQGLDKETVRDMIHYIYSCKVNNLEEKAEKLIVAADRYGLIDLKFKCEMSLCNSMNINNCLEYLRLADLCNAEKVKALVIKFIVENCREVVNMAGWEKKLFKHPTIFAQVFKALVSKPPEKKPKPGYMQAPLHKLSQK